MVKPLALPPLKIVWVVPGFVKVSTRDIKFTVEPPPVILAFATIFVIFWFEFKVIV